MIRSITAPLLALNVLALSGCVASMAASAVSMAVSQTRHPAQSNEGLRPVAASKCSEKAAEYGAMHVIDVEQRSPAKIVVWGTVEDKDERRSFMCAFGTAITDFKLRKMNPPK